MRKRKRPQDEGAGGNFDLLFLQLMMVMMAFFILLSTMAVIVENKRLQAINSVAGAFSVLPADITLSTETGPSSPSRQMGKSDSAAKRTAKELTEVAKLLGMGDAVHALPLGDGTVRVRLPERVLFRPGSAVLAAGFYPLLDVLADVLARPEITEITIAGHTDEEPMQGLRFASNWELSAARAMHVFLALAERGVPKGRMVAAGMGSGHPLPTAETQEGDNLNRRVDFYLRFRPVSTKGSQMFDASPAQGRARPVLAPPETN